MSNRTVNLKDVAAKAGVSITTVSHVINKTRFVKPETTAAVESAIKELKIRNHWSYDYWIWKSIFSGNSSGYRAYFKRKRVSNDSWEHWKLYGGAGKTIGHL